MRIGYWVFAALAVLVAGCKDKEKSFLPLPALCPGRADDICAARELCACEAQAEDCKTDQIARCEEQRDVFEADGDLHYDSVVAASLRDEQADALEACDAPFALGRFFEGTQAEGAACERDSQCESAVCDPDAKVCAVLEAVELCPAP